jgi:hypothetical protein
MGGYSQVSHTHGYFLIYKPNINIKAQFTKNLREQFKHNVLQNQINPN